jgi:hypothetical protein
LEYLDSSLTYHCIKNEQAIEDVVDPCESLLNLRVLELPPELDPFYHSFPLAPTGLPTSPIRNLLETHIPPWDRAVELCRYFLEHLSWMFQIITFQQLTQELMPSIYASESSESSSTSAVCGPHDLAVFFSTLAIAALVDLSLPPYNTEAQRYYVLARVALTLDPMMEKASLSTVKAVHLISLYNGMSGKESNMSNTYTVLNLASCLAQKVSLEHLRIYLWRAHRGRRRLVCVRTYPPQHTSPLITL